MLVILNECHALQLTMDDNLEMVGLRRGYVEALLVSTEGRLQSEVQVLVFLEGEIIITNAFYMPDIMLSAL